MYYIKLDDLFYRGSKDSLLPSDIFAIIREGAAEYETYEAAEEEYNELQKILKDAKTKHIQGVTVDNISIIEEKEVKKDVIEEDNKKELQDIIYELRKQIHYDTRGITANWFYKNYINKFANLKPHRNTEFIEKMLIGYPLNIVKIKNGKVSYARNFKTLFDFFDGTITLSGDFIPELKGKSVDDLTFDVTDKLYNYTFRVLVFE